MQNRLIPFTIRQQGIIYPQEFSTATHVPYHQAALNRSAIFACMVFRMIRHLRCLWSRIFMALSLWCYRYGVIVGGRNKLCRNAGDCGTEEIYFTN